MKLVQKNLNFGQKNKKKSNKKETPLSFKTKEIDNLEIMLKIDQREKERKY